MYCILLLRKWIITAESVSLTSNEIQTITRCAVPCEHVEQLFVFVVQRVVAIGELRGVECEPRKVPLH